jgi:hypothetical protein
MPSWGKIKETFGVGSDYERERFGAVGGVCAFGWLIQTLKHE